MIRAHGPYPHRGGAAAASDGDHDRTPSSPRPAEHRTRSPRAAGPRVNTGTNIDTDTSRCTQRMSQARCGLVAGHQSMHASRDGDTIMHWRDPDTSTAHPRRVSLDWAADGQDTPDTSPGHHGHRPPPCWRTTVTSQADER